MHSFWNCPNYPSPQFGQLVQLFSDDKIQDLKVSLGPKLLYILCISNLKNQLKVQIIIILEEIDFFYWPKMHFLKICQKIGQGPPTPLIRAMPECIEKYIPTGEQKTFD